MRKDGLSREVEERRMISVRLSSSVVADLEVLAEARGINVSDIVREAVEMAVRPRLMRPQVSAAVGTVSGSVSMRMSGGGGGAVWTAGRIVEGATAPLAR
jgi:Arc/MetJ-type ribon-helix-helix transcriptional regulator